MPNKVQNFLNRAVVADFTIAELTPGGNEPFVGVNLNTRIAQRAVITGWGASLYFQNVADFAQVRRVEFSVQRDLTLDAASTVIQTVSNEDEQVIHFDFREPWARIYPFVFPVELEVGVTNAIFAHLEMIAAPTGAAKLAVTAFGKVVVESPGAGVGL